MKIGFNKLSLESGGTINALFIGVERATTPTYPVEVELTQNTDKPIVVIGVMKGKNKQLNSYEFIPLINNNVSKE